MNRILKNVKVNVSAGTAFVKFVDELAKWWPREYTWSQDTLVTISIGREINGLCTEIGPNNFRCDWGTVTEIEEYKRLGFKWQISPTRSPVPNPEKASTVELLFSPISDFETNVELEHTDFEKHGEGYQEYLQAMNSDKGWTYILNCYADYCMK